MFSKYHYLTSNIHKAARCFVGMYNNSPVAFVGVLPSMGHKNIRRVSRLVVLPDFQGIGFGRVMCDGVASIYINNGMRFTCTTSHPGMIKSFVKNDKWKITSIAKNGKHQGRKAGTFSRLGTSAGRCVVSFEYVKNNGKKTN